LLLRMKQITTAQQFACFPPIVEDDEQSSTPSFREIERDREQPVRQLLVPERLFPDSVLLDGVGQMPAPVKEAEHLRAVREYLDLSVRRQNQADVASAQRRGVGTETSNSATGRAHSATSTNSTIRPARSTSATVRNPSQIR